jgi:hypothetical protein
MLVMLREWPLYKVKGFAPASAIPQNIINFQLLKLVYIYFLQVKRTLFQGIRPNQFDFIIIELE